MDTQKIETTITNAVTQAFCRDVKFVQQVRDEVVRQLVAQARASILPSLNFAADPVKLGTAATELADLANALTGSRAFSSVMSRDARAEELTRCCRMLIPLLDEATQREVTRRMGSSAEPTRVQTHDRDCLCQRCLDEAGRGR